VDEYIQARSAPALAGAADGVVEGWAVLAEKDSYDDVDMTNLPVDYAGLTQLRELLRGPGWPAANIRELREFDRARWKRVLSWLAQNADADDLVLVYVASHGMYLKRCSSGPSSSPLPGTPSPAAARCCSSIPARRKTTPARCWPTRNRSWRSPRSRGRVRLERPAREGLPIVGGVFTHYFVAAFAAPAADGDGSGRVSSRRRRSGPRPSSAPTCTTWVFAVPEFREMYDVAAVGDSTFPTSS